MDRMRESVFAVLGDLSRASFLDLFSGSGIIALEAASRGADPVEAVEADVGKRSVLLSNTALAPCRITCRFMPVERYIKRIKTKRFTHVFCDPPFPYQYKTELVCSLAASPLIESGALLLLHYPRTETLVLDGCGFSLTERREYGRSRVDFFRRD
jgi:16S rRNA (guanine(966)-N(2))-methyltransferase RsmD